MGHWRLAALMAMASLCGSNLIAQISWASAGLPGHAANFQQVWADGDGAIYYAGAPSVETDHNALMCYTDGHWDALDTLDGLISTVVKYRDTLFVGGSFDVGASATTHGVEYYDGSGWQPYGEFDIDADVRRLRVIEDTLYAVGTFSSIDGVPSNGVAKRVGGSWVPVGLFTEPEETVLDIVKYRDTLVVIGPDFDTGRDIGFLDHDGQWKLLGPGILGGLSGAHSLAVYQNNLYVGGQISLPAGNPGQEIMKWNGSAFEGLGQGLQWSENNTTSFCDVRAMVEHDGLLFVGGGCNYAGGIPSHGVAVWDGSRWCSVPGHPNQDEGVFGMDFYRDTLFITCGYVADGDSVNLAAKFVGTSYIDSCGAPVGIAEHEQPVAPAPTIIQTADGQWQVLGLGAGQHPYMVMDALGRIIEKGSVIGAGPSIIPTGGLCAGVYMVCIEGHAAQRVIKSNGSR
ncbi:MAG: hypothetical protein JST45_04235 [Bacteroidetes bacterium]|nr:hypothetical protein [Bacteroidota bacterium]